nr:MAG TPA: hypothetical protein [Caudoviricetes sp.]DAQ12390.1 MAG TPA: hypothetical protein [Bacteriophage sp.]DAR55737.1 MAG TPA: hypothetical protein [Caudoviricetes sp.]DAT72723.1 MAG TPA: hypothetical protein [Caudoviricetes sp.]DAU74217.1 MAG TPA: hypothetical protein [Caudoviricetes sp.]
MEILKSRYMEDIYISRLFSKLPTTPIKYEGED